MQSKGKQRKAGRNKTSLVL